MTGVILGTDSDRKNRRFWRTINCTRISNVSLSAASSNCNDKCYYQLELADLRQFKTEMQLQCSECTTM